MLLGLDLGGTKLSWAYIDQDGSITKSGHIPSQDVCPETLSTRLAQEIPHKESVQGIGWAVAGSFQDTRIAYGPNIRSWEGMDLQEVFETWDVPVHVEYDGHAALLGELWSRHGQALPESILMLVIGTGIGGAIMVNGQLWRGNHGLAGVIGTAPSFDGLSLEAWASGPAIAKRSQTVDGREALTRCQNRDPRAVAAFARASDALYTAVAQITAITDIADVVIGGGFGLAAFPELFPETTLPQSYALHPVTHRHVQIRKAFSEKAALIGSVAPWLHPLA